MIPDSTCETQLILCFKACQGCITLEAGLPAAPAAGTRSAVLMGSALGAHWKGLPSLWSKSQTRTSYLRYLSLSPPCRLTQWLRVLPILPRFPVSVYLIKQSNSTGWGLIDAGLPDSPRQQHATQLLAALRAAIPEGQELEAIVCE